MPTPTNIPVKSHTDRNGSVLGPGVSADVTNGNSVVNDGNTLILAVGGASAYAITFVTSGTVGGLSVTDNVQSVGITENKMFGPFPVALYGSVLNITHGASSTVKLTPLNITAR